jgi:FeS assembly SUF system regulator
LVWFWSETLIRLGRLTDYGIVVMSHIAADGDSILTARELAERSSLPLPTVSKVLKSLAKANLIESHRGVNGGYQLARAPEKIRVTDMIDALEGPIAMTDCSGATDHCIYDQHCPVKSPWQKINAVVRNALSQMTLHDLRRLS